MEWIARQNIKRFEKLIAGETDPDRRACLETLLQGERTRLSAALSPGTRSADLAPHDRRPLPKQALTNTDVLALVADAVICADEDGRILLFNRAAEQTFGYSAHEVLGEPVDILLPQRHRAEHARQVQDFAAGGSEVDRVMGLRREVRGCRKNGEEFAAEATVSRHSVDGRTILTVVHRDITERKALEDQREAIARELDHRVRNLLSVVSSLVSISARSAANVEELKDSLLGRLRALATTQTMLRRGPRERIRLDELLLAELDHYRSPDGTNVVMKGEPVVLCPTAVQPLALAIHELATNSAKYGALSDPNGRVTLTFEGIGERDESLLLIEWREAGGPTVKPPVRPGFGTTFIEQMIRRTLRAEVAVDYRPEGLVCRMTLPRAKVEASPSAGPP